MNPEPSFAQIAQLVERYRSGKLTENDFLRNVIAFPSWRVCAQRQGEEAYRIATVVTPEGGRILELFSSSEAWESFREREQEHREDDFLQAPGFHIFSQLKGVSIDRVNFDLHSPHAFHYKGEQVALLNQWTQVVEAELALARPELFQNPFGILRRFPSFWVALRKVGAERDLVLAPDSTERNLAAIFTAPDTAAEFLGAVDIDEGELELVMQSAAELFAELRHMPLDGMVFNPLSHVPPVALNIRVLEQLVEH